MPSRPAKAATQRPSPKRVSPPAPAAPATAEARSFRALLEADHTSLKWTVARVPFSCAAVWPHMLRRRVAGTINGHPFRTTLFPAPAGGPAGEVILVNKKMQAAAHVHLGSQADFVLWADLAERPAQLPPELLSAFEGDKALLRWTLNLSDSNRREIGKWINDVKSSQSRVKRAQQMAERLLLAMQGESEIPPILELLFRANPKARAGWLALTPYQRRCHLLGIFNYQSPEARERRALKAVDESLRRLAREPHI